ncbi:MAG TPA: 50S ribosomal protein L19 [Spirochaetales bacterium]|nr:50S ribosomal protein L19 [Spirochaetales bacterium]
MDLIKAIEAEQIRDGQTVRIGDTVRVYFSIIEGKNERVQVYEGTVIAQKNSGLRKTITVRKISYGVGVERVFPLHSPRIQKIEVVRHGRIRRAKLYYLRSRVGKAAKVAELIQKKKVAATQPAPEEQTQAE